MDMNISQISTLLVETVDQNRNGNLEGTEIRNFLEQLEQALSQSGSGSDSVQSGLNVERAPSLLATLSGSEKPSHDFKVLLNDTLVSSANELGLSLVNLPGANYPAVDELRPAADGSLTSTQAGIRRQLTELVVDKLQNDPLLPANFQVKVENPNAGSGADRIALKWEQSDWLVFDVITGSGILKSRIAKNYLADSSGFSVDATHQRQLELLGSLSSRLAALNPNELFANNAT